MNQPSVQFSQYWSGLLFPSPGDLPNRGMEPGSPALQADALPSESPGKTLSRSVRSDSLRPQGLQHAVQLSIYLTSDVCSPPPYICGQMRREDLAFQELTCFLVLSACLAKY